MLDREPEVDVEIGLVEEDPKVCDWYRVGESIVSEVDVAVPEVA